jgi:hypothetical protein
MTILPAAAAVIALLCSGCFRNRARSDSYRIGPDMWSVSCGRSKRLCYEEAAYRCPRGFSVLDGTDHRGSEATATKIGSNVLVSERATYDGELLVRCDPPTRHVAKPPQPPPDPSAGVRVRTTEVQRGAPDDGDPYSLGQ